MTIPVYKDGPGACCCCCPNPPTTVIAQFEGGAEDGWAVTLNSVYGGSWASGFRSPPDPKCGPYVGLNVKLGCANGLWYATISGWVDISDNNGTLVSVSCDPFQVIMSFNGYGDNSCPECKIGFQVRFVAG